MFKDKSIKLNVVFMGTSELAEESLRTLIENNYNIVGVYTKPDPRVGRDQQTIKSPVKLLAEELNLKVFQPLKFTPDVISELKELKPDLIIVAAYGKILPKAVLDMPGLGCINIHGSLLPKFRGPSPIQNALLCGATETGISIMIMDQGIDTGAVISQKSIAIDPNDTYTSLYKKLSILGSKLLIEILPQWIGRKIEPVEQNNSQATICQLIDREDGRIFWNEDAQTIYNKYRALTPWPGIYSYIKIKDRLLRLKLIDISLRKDLNSEYQEGEVFVLGDKIGVKSLNGTIVLNNLQLEGKRAMTAQEFMNGYKEFVGSILQ